MRKRCASTAAPWTWGCATICYSKTQWEIGRLEKKLERYESALAVYTDLAAARNPYRAQALEELAKTL